MTLRTKIYIALAGVAIFAAVFLAGSMWTQHKLAASEHELHSAKADAAAAETRSGELEAAAAEYREKIKYLEASLSELERIAAPTLVIGTAEDTIHPLTFAESLAGMIPSASFVRITSKSVDAARHVAEFKAALSEFLTRVAA